MSVSFATARAVVQAANAAGKKITITTTDGQRIAGTARWRDFAQVLAGAIEAQLVLFSVNSARGPWTEYSSGTHPDGTVVRNAWAFNPAPDRHPWGGSTSDDRAIATLEGAVEWPARATITLPLTRIASIAQTADGDSDLLPWQTSSADAVTLSPDLAGVYGSGQE